MSLLDLPTELRLEILTYVPDFTLGRPETIGPNIRLTPPICRVNRILREEALSLYAKTGHFIIHADDNSHNPNKRVQLWLQALGDEAIGQVQNLQLSKHWKGGLPTRWQGHHGFYARIRLLGREWRCDAGTYPIANDLRHMRCETIALLRSIVLRRFNKESSASQPNALTKEHVEFVVAAMDIVASHPVSPFDVEQSDTGKVRRRETFGAMEGKLLALQAAADYNCNTVADSHVSHS